MSNHSGGPYLCTAIFCEKILTERDGVLSAIRMFDRWTVRGEAEQMPPTPIPLSVLIAFKAGIMRGPSNIGLHPVSPSGEKLPAIEFPVNFEGDDDRGVAIAINIGFTAQESGIYWFDVRHAGELVTRIPLRVLYQRAGTIRPPES